MLSDGISTEGRVLAGRITNGDVAGARHFLKEGAFGGKPWPINAFVNTTGTALHHAAQMGQREICEMLLEHGANVNFQRQFGTGEEFDSGYAPLHLAAHYGHPEIVALFIQHGAHPNAIAYSGLRPLHMATCNEGMHVGWARCVEALLDAGADPNVFAARAPDPRHWSLASYYQNKPEYRDANWHFTPLHFALDTSGTIDVLMRESAASQDFRGCRVVARLLTAGSDPFVLPQGAPRFYLTPLQTAVKHAPSADLKLLLALEGVDLGQRSLAGKSLVQLAADRPENKALIMAAKTDKRIQDSIKLEVPKEVEGQTVRKSKGLMPL